MLGVERCGLRSVCGACGGCGGTRIGTDRLLLAAAAALLPHPYQFYSARVPARRWV